VNVFFLVVARDRKHVKEKIDELTKLHVPFVIVCGEKLPLSHVVFRKAKGKYDAINYGSKYVDDEAELICLNDVDTEIHNFKEALKFFNRKKTDMIFCKVVVTKGPQVYFYPLLDSIRRRVLITASGELMVIRSELFRKLLPLPQCESEDTYMLFKALELGYKAYFCEKCWTETERTETLTEEASYKERTVRGIYQALRYSTPPLVIRLFYAVLPLFTPLLAIYGKKGFSWIKGILDGVTSR